MPEAQDSPGDPRPAGPASRPPRPPVHFGVVAVVIVLIVYYAVRARGPGRLVVYCAHDAVYSEKILLDFQKKTGIRVAAKQDSEATKSLGLVEQIIKEGDAPVCDVFWNNQLLGTLQLQEEGLLLPYKGSGFERIPDGAKDPGGEWVGFAARLRVWIVNTDRLEPTREAVRRALEGDLSRVAVAKPLYGTTLTHYSVLWHQWGEEKLKAWHRDWRERRVCEAASNGHVKNLVAQGVCDLGLTDTDDFFVAKDEGRPVAMLPVRVDGGATICIPNTVAIIRGTGRQEQAKRFVDYLLSEECELALANSKSRQVPLGPVDQKRLPEEVRELAGWAAEGYPLSTLSRARAECLGWLKSEYLK
jgi:iron(III) transport system substrate-binding protein